MEFAARLPVKFQDVKFKDPKFMKFSLKHSYFSNYFIICLPSIFSVIKVIIIYLIVPNTFTLIGSREINP